MPERIELEREALGSDFRDAPLVRTELDYKKDHNLEQIALHVEKQTARIRQSFVDGTMASDAELIIYEDLVLYLLYRRYRLDLEATIAESQKQQSAKIRIGF